MFKVKSNQLVGVGNYWDIWEGRYIHMKEPGVLPDNGSYYLKMSPVVMLLVAPVVGLTYAVFLPFIGIAMLTGLVFKKAFNVFMDVLYRATVFGWRPSESYLQGRRGKKRDEKDKCGE